MLSPAVFWSLSTTAHLLSSLSPSYPPQVPRQISFTTFLLLSPLQSTPTPFLNLFFKEPVGKKSIFRFISCTFLEKKRTSYRRRVGLAWGYPGRKTKTGSEKIEKHSKIREVPCLVARMAIRVSVNLVVNKTSCLTSTPYLGLKRVKKKKMAGALWCNFYGLWDALKSVTEKQPEKQIANLRARIVVKAAESTKQAEIKANFQEMLGGKKQLCCVRVSHQEEECILLWFFFSKHGFEVNKGEWAHLPVEIKFHSYNW